MRGVTIDSLAKLLEPCAPEDFLASVWGKTYKHVKGRAGKFAALMPWEHLNYILRRHRLDHPRLRLVEDGAGVPPADYLRYVSARRGRVIPRLRAAELTRLLARGTTLVLDAVDELHEPTETLASALEHFFRERVQINLYAGWHESRGFDLHWDDHDVFVLQVAGRKRWSVYGETRVNPSAGETVPQPAGAPLWEGILEDGDLLYIPRGWWHVAVPLNEPTLHLTAGVHNRTGLDLLRWLSERLAESDLFRRDLPRFKTPEERASHAAALRRELLEHWTDDLTERFFQDLDRRALARPHLSLPWSPTDDVLPTNDGARLRLVAPRPLELKEATDGALEFECLGRRWRFAEAARPVLSTLAARRSCTVAELCAAASAAHAAGADARTVRRFLGELLRHGLVAVEPTAGGEGEARR